MEDLYKEIALQNNKVYNQICISEGFAELSNAQNRQYVYNNSHDFFNLYK